MPVIAARRPMSAWCFQEVWEHRASAPDHLAPLPPEARFGLCVVGESLDAVFAAMSDETEGRRLSARDDAALRHTLQTLPPGRAWYLVSVVAPGDDGPTALGHAIADVRRVAEAVIEVCPSIAGWRILVRGAAPIPAFSPVSPVSPVARAVAEAALVLRTELECDVRVVDFDDIPMGKDRLLMELVRGTEPVVAVRGEERFTPRLSELASSLPVRDLRARNGSCCVITDGLSSHALTLARHLVAVGHRRLALVARRGPSLEDGPEDRDSSIGALNANLRAVDELRAAGASVRVFAADLTDSVALARVLDGITGSMGPIGLVLHTTATPESATVGTGHGMSSAGLFATRSAIAARAMLAALAGLGGAGIPLILFSSMGARRGAAGQFEHAASTGYLDGLAHAANTVQRPVLAIASNAVQPAGAARLLLSLVAHGHTGVVALSPETTEEESTAHEVTPEARRRTLGGDPVLPRNRREVRLAELWRDALRIDTVGVEDDFFALGGSSLLLTKLVARARRQLGVALPLAELLGAPTIANWLRDPDASFDVHAHAPGAREWHLTPDCAV